MNILSELTESRKALRDAGFDPIPLAGKRPAFNGWQTKLDTPDKDIERWATAHPGAKSTGLLTENTPALDIDIKNDDAATAVEKLTIERFRDSGVVLTRFGNAPKRAILFRTDKPFSKITINLIAPDGSTGQKLEFLGKGQQLVCHGIHPDTKRPYQWVGDEPGKVARDELPSITESEARKLMNDAATILVRDHGYKRAKERPKETPGASNGPEDWAHLFENIRTGTDYHDSLRNLSAKMVRSGMNGGAVVNVLYGLMDKSEGKHDHRWLARKNEIKRLVAGAEGKTINSDSEAPKSGLEYFDDAIAETKSKNWLIKNVVALMETSSWIGPPKSGKSAFLVDLCIAISRGEDWRGYTIKKQAGVVYFALERGDLVKRRLKGHAKRDKIKGIPFALRKGIINLTDDGCIDFIVGEINEAAKNFGCEVGIIVIDTYSKGIAAGGGNEDKAADQNKVAANLRVVQERTGVHIALVGHTGKDESRGARGSNARLGDDDVMAQFSTEKDDIVAVEITGANDQPEGPLTRFKMERVDIGHDPDGEVESTFIVDQEEHGKHKAAKRLPPQKQLALDILHREMKAHGKKTKDGDYQQHLLSIEVWKAACKSEGLSAGEATSFERVFRDCVNKLREWKKIAIVDGNIRLFFHPGGPARDGMQLNSYQLLGVELKQLKAYN